MRRNSEQIRLVQSSWGPSFDHLPGFNNFVKICQNSPIPQSAQIWPSGRASGLEPRLPTPGLTGSIPPVCSNLGVSGWAQGFFRGKNKPFPNLHRGPRIYLFTKKSFCPHQSHLDWNIREESNLTPCWVRQAFQAGGPTTRPDLHGLGDGTI